MLTGGSSTYRHDLDQVSWVGSVLYRSCTTSHNGSLGSTVDDLDRDLFDMWNLGTKSRYSFRQSTFPNVLCYALYACSPCRLTVSHGCSHVVKALFRLKWKVCRKGSTEVGHCHYHVTVSGLCTKYCCIYAIGFVHYCTHWTDQADPHFII